jgi:L-alanine-DL-glutamate epimerase-like enolase superfamily enzyme
MQITKAEVIPVELGLHQPARMANIPDISSITALFVRIETRQGRAAWGCSVVHPHLTGENVNEALIACRKGADMAPGLHPTNLEYSLAELHPVIKESPAAVCAFDLAFYDLLGLFAGLPLYRLLGGYRNRIQTSITVALTPLHESVEIARERASRGFRMLKVKGGLDPDEDVRRIKAIHAALPEHVLRLDADGGYDVQSAIDVARALEGQVEMLEQPTPAEDLDGLRQVTLNSPVPILADQSVTGPASVLDLASRRSANGLSIKMAMCGGISCARQIDAVARTAQLTLMVSCIIEPALLIAAGLSFALSSPNVQFGDLDGHLEIIDDPTVASFLLKDGWLVATDTPGLGCSVEI